MLNHEQTIVIVEETIKRLKEDGTVHVNCPLDGMDKHTLENLKTLPGGAVNMLRMTWGVFSRFGDMAGKAIAVGAFIVIISLLCIGGIALLKAGEFVMGLGK